MLTKCDILVPDENVAELLSGFLAVRVSSGWEEQSLASGEIRFVIHAFDTLFVQNLVDALHVAFPLLVVSTANVEEEDWQQSWREFFTPIACGEHFIVLPP